jgi:hypothetical protein
MTSSIDIHDFVKSYEDQLDLFDGPYPVQVIFVPNTYTLPSGRTRNALFTGKVYVVRYDDVALHTITMDGKEEVTNVVVDIILEKMGIELRTVTGYLPYIVSADAPCMPEEPNWASYDDPDALPF